MRQFLDRSVAKVGDVEILIGVHLDIGWIAHAIGNDRDNVSIRRDPFDDVIAVAVGHIDVARAVHGHVPRRLDAVGGERG